MASRSHGRQLTVQLIYQTLFSEYPFEDAARIFWEQHETDDTTRHFSTTLARGVLDNRTQLDLEITGYLKNWSLDRIVTLDRIILEMAFFELIHTPQVPWKVVIDEAVMLGKLFSSEKSAVFINGVLHAWVTRNRSDTEDENADGTEK